MTPFKSLARIARLIRGLHAPPILIIILIENIIVRYIYPSVF
mgnify:CR=1 FL=1